MPRWLPRTPRETGFPEAEKQEALQGCVLDFTQRGLPCRVVYLLW